MIRSLRILFVKDHSQVVHAWFPVSPQLPLLQLFVLGQHIISECLPEIKLAEVTAALFLMLPQMKQVCCLLYAVFAMCEESYE